MFGFLKRFFRNFKICWKNLVSSMFYFISSQKGMERIFQCFIVSYFVFCSAIIILIIIFWVFHLFIPYMQKTVLVSKWFSFLLLVFVETFFWAYYYLSVYYYCQKLGETFQERVPFNYKERRVFKGNHMWKIVFLKNEKPKNNKILHMMKRVGLIENQYI